MAIYIDDGVNVNAAWVSVIAVSRDGVNYETINKTSVNVLPVFVNQPQSDKVPFLNKGDHGMIRLTQSDEDNVLLEFDPNDVVNQVTWQGNTPAALQQAVSDISSWL